MTCQFGHTHKGATSLGEYTIRARGNRGDNHSQSNGGSKAVGQANKQSETFRNLVSPRKLPARNL